MTLPLSYTLEDAISETKFGKFNHFLIALSGLILACGMYEATSITLIFPIAQCELQMTNFHKGLLGSVGFIGIILSSHFWGFLADTRGRKKIIVNALLLASFFSLCSTFAKNFWILAFFRLIVGFCICAPQGIIYAFLGEFHSSKHRARVLIIASVIYGISCLLTSLNALLFLNQETWNIFIPFLNLNYSAWRIFILISSVPNIISAILMIFFIPESPKFTYAQGDEIGTLNILKRIYICNTGREDYAVKSLIKEKEFEDANNVRKCSFFKFMWSQTVPLFNRSNIKNTMTACYLQFGLCFASNGYWIFFPEITNKVLIWLENDSSHTTATICNIISTFDFENNSTVAENIPTTCVKKLEMETLKNIALLSILYSCGWFLMSIIIDKTGKLAIIVFIAFSCGIASIFIMFLQIPQAALYVYLVLLSAGLNMSVVNTSTVELFPTTLRAMAVSISMMFGRVGSVVGSNFVGLTIRNFCTYTFIVPAVLLISGGFLAFTIPNINKREKK
ncbi:hypothetical protein PVAND_012395 [Polypedilum vanderplanki]|uniref:Major facilitator superfamily (MFS) profile domain-containing protein n=1 Tax=Polypedilum vanderplanki TaxID=319348 RepID=A0A9J6CMC4_POLVA|nr:hypothetical protein PVAND_012395 [Polypedilum vanderplanki]